MAVIQLVISAAWCKLLSVPAKGLLKIRPSPHSSLTSPLSQGSYDKSAVGDITDAGSYVRNLCYMTYIPCGSAATEATWGQRRGEVPQGVRVSMRAVNRQETRGALFRAGTSDPCMGLFVWVTRECPSCHQLEKTLFIGEESVRELESPDSVHVSHWRGMDVKSLKHRFCQKQLKDISLWNLSRLRIIRQ